MTSRGASTAASPPPGLSRHASVLRSLQADPPAVVMLKRRLLIAATEKPARLRSDLDLLVITQYLMGLDAFQAVSVPVLHCTSAGIHLQPTAWEATWRLTKNLLEVDLATECTLLTLRDGDVFCYQDDPVKDNGTALVVVDGSICGYHNKAFSQRPNKSESFMSWNAQQTKRRGVLIDFGEIHATYSSGALCGFEDLLTSLPRPVVDSTAVADADAAAPELQWRRRRGMHAQERTRAIAFSKDSLDRAVARFGLSEDRGQLASPREAASGDVSYVAIFSQLAESSRQTLVAHGPRRIIPKGESLFATGSGSASIGNTSTTLSAFVVVLVGRLDLYWTGDLTEGPRPLSVEDKPSTTPAAGSTPSSPSAGASAESALAEWLQLCPLYSIRRGQCLGDQTLGLDLDALSSPSPSNVLPVRVVAGEDNTEVLLISRHLFDAKRREDHVVQSYAATMAALRQRARGEIATTGHYQASATFRSWAADFFAAKTTMERSIVDLYELAWRLGSDALADKVFGQFPPVVLERLCHSLELLDADGPTPTTLIEPGGSVQQALVVMQGRLRYCQRAPSPKAKPTASDQPTTPAAPAESVAAKDDEHEREHAVWLPGDVFGVHEILERRNLGRGLVADPGTLLLAIPRLVVERWLPPLQHTVLWSPGSLLQAHAKFSTTMRPVSFAHEKRKSLSLSAGGPRRVSSSHYPPSPTRPGAEDDANNGLTTSTIAPTEGRGDGGAPPHVGDLGRLLQRLGLLAHVPRCLLPELLTGAALIHRRAGDVIIHEHEHTTALVLIVHGFVAFYSLENMASTIDMFRRHSFCHFASLHHLLARQALRDHNGDASSSSAVAAAAAPMAALTRHRSAIYGIHLQTLHAGNAFRAGILQDTRVCPATVVAHTDCDLLVLDDGHYASVLRQHAPVLDLGAYDEPGSPVNTPLAPAAGDHPLPVTVARLLAPAAMSWLTSNPLQLQALLKEATLVRVPPGARVFRHGDAINRVAIVLSGALTLYLRPNHEEVTNVLDASQRSVRSLMLERSVASNYSTTSQQLYTTRDAQRTQHKRAFLKHRVNRMLGGAGGDAASSAPSSSASSPSGTNSSLFVHSVLAAVHDDKRQRTQQPLQPSAADPAPTPSSPKRSGGLSFHSAVAKATLRHRLDRQRQGLGTGAVTSAPGGVGGLVDENDGGDDGGESSSEDPGPRGSLVLCQLHPGDVYGLEALSPLTFRAPHDVFADVTHGTELVCFDRRAFLAITAKTDDELEHELRGRARAVRAKWQLAEQKVIRRISETGGRSAAAPKLYDLFKNILNQRYFLTMRAIVEIPLLQELPDALKQELCSAARFEAVDRLTNVYKDSGHGGPGRGESPMTTQRYFFVLNGRVGLFPRSAVAAGSAIGTGASSGNGGGGHHGSMSMGPATTAGGQHQQYLHQHQHQPHPHPHPLQHVQLSAHAAAALVANTDACLREVPVGQGFGEFEILVPEAPRQHILALALERTKLLSFPAEVFHRVWPGVEEMRRNVAYVRDAVPYFRRLDLERLAYLYHALAFDDYDRGATVLEQYAPLDRSWLFLLKSGECSIQTKLEVTATATPDHTDEGEDGGDGPDVVEAASALGRGRDGGIKPLSGLLQQQQQSQQRAQQASTPTSSGQRLLPTPKTPPPRHMMRVLATIADVSGGHVLWLDGRQVPFTLRATSARVAMASIPLDRLRLILPKASLAQLEDCSERLAMLYRQQVAMARRAIVRVLNHKRDAEMGRTPAPTFMPMLHYGLQRQAKHAQLTTNGTSSATITTMRLRPPVDGDDSSNSERQAEAVATGSSRSSSNNNSSGAGQRAALGTPAIPFARILSSQPIDINELQQDEHRERARTHGLQHDQGDSDGDGEPPRPVESSMDTLYREVHQLEHYRAPNAVLAGAEPLSPTTLRGSFPNDPPLRQRLTRTPGPSRADADADDHPLAPELALAKSEELQAPELAIPSPGSPSPRPIANGPKASTWRVHIRVPVPARGSGSSPSSASPRRSHRPHSGASPSPTGGLDETLESLLGPVTVTVGGRSCNSTTGYDGDGDDDVDEILDLRELLMAEMQSALSPLRAIRLEPSACRIHSLGKYLESAAATAEADERRPWILSSQDARVSDGPQCNDTTAAADSNGKRHPAMAMTPRGRRDSLVAALTPRSTAMITAPLDAPRAQVLRRQGFLRVAVLRSPSDGDHPQQQQQEQQQQAEQLDAEALKRMLAQALPRQRRAFYRLLDDRLLEYGADCDLHALPSSSSQQPTRTFDLKGAGLREPPDLDERAPEAVVLRHSLVLQLPASRQWLLATAESMTDKRGWWNELEMGARLGQAPELIQRVPHHGLGPWPRARKPPAPSPSTTNPRSVRERRRLSQIGGLWGPEGGDSDRVLEVEYRIP